jgi:ectoine hydroxylase-related dioxygenase (phytanoyl-CoA dioxygenase family)
MTPEQDYHLDVAGYVILKQVLPAAQRSAEDLLGSEVLAQYLVGLCGEEYVLDRPPCWLEPTDQNADLQGGNEPLNWARSYYQQNDVRFCQALLVLLSLDDIAEGDGGFTLVPASHNSCVETPTGVLDGADDIGLTRQPALAAGDLLLCVPTTLHGMRPWTRGPRRLLACTIFAKEARRSQAVDETVTQPDWWEQMTPAQRALMRPANVGTVPMLRSDGTSLELDESGLPYHPGLYRRDPTSPVDARELYFWDLNGYLVLPGIMEAEWLQAARVALDANCDRYSQGGSPSKASRRLKGTPLTSLHGLFELPSPHCDPFRRMIADPAIILRLNWMMGGGFRVGPVRAMIYEPGSSGLRLHGGSEPANSRNNYRLQNGRAWCHSVNVAWQLGDVDDGDGGFVCVPGSHKARFPVPEGIELCDDELGLVRHVTGKAGDVVLFMGAAQTHGAYPWVGQETRRVALLNYQSPHRA